MDRNALNKTKTALLAELARSQQGLRAPGHPKIYYLSYLFRDIVGYSVWARYGTIWTAKPVHKRNVYADIRVGSHRFDQTSKGGLTDNSEEDDSFDHCSLPVEDDIDTLRYALWRLTDARYREAVVAYHRRQARLIHFRNPDAGFPSFEKGAPHQASPRLSSSELDTDYWDDYVRRASRVFKKHTDFQNTFVDFSARTITKVFVNTEGSELVWQSEQYSLTANLWMLMDNGEVLDTAVVKCVTRLSDLPSWKEFVAEIEAKIELVRELAAGETITSYSGPVLLAPVPAGLFVHEVLGHRLEGNRMLSDDEGKTFKDKIGKPITHSALDIYDDPSLKGFHGTQLIGHFPYDDEGTPSERTELLENGILRQLLTSRAPLKGRGHKSNGHARNEAHERPISRMGNLIIESKDGRSWEELKGLLIEEVRRRELPYGIILLECEGGETETESYDFQAFLGEITVAKMIFPDGSETYLRGVDFVGTPLASLSNVTAVGKSYEVDNAYCTAESGTIPVSTVSPALLISNLELQAKDLTRITSYLLPMPWAEQ